MRILAAMVTAAGLFLAGLSGPARADDPEQFDIGAILAMTGSAPYIGLVMSRGARMAVEEINADGGIDGIPLNLIIEDHQSGKAKEGVAAMQRLLSLHNTQAVLSSFSPPTLAIAPIADREKIFVINGGAVSTALVNASKYMVHNRELASSLAKGVVTRAKELGAKRLAIVHWKTDAGDSARDVIRGLWTGDGREIVATESVVQGAANIDTQIAKVKVSRPDAVALGLFEPETGLVVKRLRELGVDVPIIGIDWTNEDATIAGKYAEGFEYVIEVFRPSPDNPWAQAFADKWHRQFDEDPDIYGANYYEATYVIAELIRRAKAKGGDYWHGDKLYEALFDDPTFKSVYAPTMTFDKETGIAHKPVALYRTGADGKGAFVRYLETRE